MLQFALILIKYDGIASWWKKLDFVYLLIADTRRLSMGGGM